MQNYFQIPEKQDMGYSPDLLYTGDYPSPPGPSEFDVDIDDSLPAPTHFSGQVPDPTTPYANFSPTPTALSEGYSPASCFTKSPPTSFGYPTPRDDEVLPLVHSPASSTRSYPFTPSQSLTRGFTKDEIDLDFINCGMDPRTISIHPGPTRTHSVSNHGGLLLSTTSPTFPSYSGNEIPGQGIGYHGGPFQNMSMTSHPGQHDQLDWSKVIANPDDLVTVPNERPRNGVSPRPPNGNWDYPPKVIVLEEARNTDHYPRDSIGATAPRPHKTPKRKAVKHDSVENAYKCDFPGCKYTSDRPYNLKTHQKTHEDDPIKDFACSYCEYASTRKYDRDRHMEKRHRELHARTSIATISTTAATSVLLNSPPAGREEQRLT